VSGLRGRALAGLGVAAALAGCGSGSPSPAPSATPVKGPTTDLANVPDGTAVLSWDEKTKKLSIKLGGYGLTPNSAHALHLTPSRCTAKQGTPAFTFPDVTADGAGAVDTTVTATQPAPKGIPSGMEIDLHLVSTADSGKGPDAAGTPIACTDIPTTTASRIAVRLYPFPGQKPAATATVAYDQGAKTLSVHLTGFGLAPKSTHAVDIDAGSCEKQGAQRFALKDAVAGTEGRIDVTTTVTGVSEVPPKVSWYLLVHQGSRSEILSGGRPATPFRPILCGDLARV
jgi:hypothetical protein